jgi:hypothetical protein
VAVVNPDILLASDGPYWNMSSLTEAGEAFVKAHSSPTPDSRVRGVISIGAGAYPQIIEAARAAGLTVRVS